MDYNLDKSTDYSFWFNDLLTSRLKFKPTIIYRPAPAMLCSVSWYGILPAIVQQEAQYQDLVKRIANNVRLTISCRQIFSLPV